MFPVFLVFVCCLHICCVSGSLAWQTAEPVMALKGITSGTSEAPWRVFYRISEDPGTSNLEHLGCGIVLWTLSVKHLTFLWSPWSSLMWKHMNKMKLCVVCGLLLPSRGFGFWMLFMVSCLMVVYLIANHGELIAYQLLCATGAFSIAINAEFAMDVSLWYHPRNSIHSAVTYSLLFGNSFSTH